MAKATLAMFLEEYNSIISKYRPDAKIDENGNISIGDRYPGLVISVNNGRMYIRDMANVCVYSACADPWMIADFVETFWYWKRPAKA